MRQIEDIERISDLALAPADSKILLVRADYVYELRTLKKLSTRRSAALRCEVDQQLVAAIVPVDQAPKTVALLSSGGLGDGNHIQILEPRDLDSFDELLRRAEPPMLEPLSEQTRRQVEDKLYGSSYKGITDLVTKWLWPRPAKIGVRLCAAAGISPNMVTSFGLLLMILTCYLFLHGQFFAGLIAGWLMTFLDTVDGKLARVTVQSSKFGHILDHGMDAVHPPFWYVLWGMALIDLPPVFGFTQSDMYWLIVGGYVIGRIAEMSFHALGSSSIFTWKPFDAYFRLITARRNPCLIILTAGWLVGRPDLGFVGVAAWTVATSVILVFRLLQGTLVRLRHGPLQSWMHDRETAQRQFPQTYRRFAGTRSAYAPG